jgi:hypothetical protein
MATCLDTIWDAYESSLAAAKVVRRCVLVGGIDRDRAFRNTRFHGQSDAECERLLQEAERDLSDAVVVSLYGKFESRLREHLVGQAPLLANATAPDSQFGVELAALFEAQCDGFRMDLVTDLFRSAVGTRTLHRASTVRTYRHLLAHGRSWAAPSTITAVFAYGTLTDFLTLAGLP